MSLTITKLLAKCDVDGCEKSVEASLQQLSTQGWSFIYHYDGKRALVSATDGMLNLKVNYSQPLVCPSCSVQGHWKKMSKEG